MTSIELSRFILAKPSSVALVLAGPAARELWPQPDERRIVALGGSPAGNAAVSVDPPRRAGVGFLAHITVAGAGLTVGAGKLAIQPARGDGAGCELSLTLTGADHHAERLRRDGRRYLDNIARVSRERSSAA